MLQSIPGPEARRGAGGTQGDRASIEALNAEIKKISEIERQQAQLYTARGDYRSKRIREEEFATLIEQQLLPPGSRNKRPSPRFKSFRRRNGS